MVNIITVYALVTTALAASVTASANMTMMFNFTWPQQHNSTNLHIVHHNLTKRLDTVITPNQLKVDKDQTAMVVAVVGAALSAIIAFPVIFIYFQRRASKKANATIKTDYEATVESFGNKPTPYSAPTSVTLRKDEPRKGDLGTTHKVPKKPRTAHYTRVRDFGQSRFVEVDLADVPDVRRSGV